MVNQISPASLRTLQDGDSPFALIDVREAGEYNSTHIPDSSLISRRDLEFRMSTAVPVKNAQVVLCDDDGRRANLAAATLERMGYTSVSVLEGGIARWSIQNYPTEWGSNVISKDFGEKMEVVNHVPEIDATDLHDRIERRDKLVILDTRTPQEYQSFCIPGGRSVPGGELALRITDITKDLDPDTTVIINCAGRTRSVIGTRILQRMGLTNIYGLKNGTSGWLLAGYDLELDADRLDLPEPSAEGLAAAEAYADKCAQEDGVRYLDIPALQAMISKLDRETAYLVDVRTSQEYQKGHMPGFQWFPGGQVVQRSDDVLVVKNCPVVFTCDDKVRGTLVASWYRQFGFKEVYVVQGGTSAWSAAGLTLEPGSPQDQPFGLAEAKAQVKAVSPQELQASQPALVIFVDNSEDFTKGHVPGARWVPRGYLELQIDQFAPTKETAITVTCDDGRQSALAGATLEEMGYQNVSVLEGGMAAWQQASLPVESGLSGVMIAPTDMVNAGANRNFSDRMLYLRWETALGDKYQTSQG